MLREFAVEPSLFGDWSDFRYLQGKFDFSQARVIAEFPKKWRRLVYEAASGFSPGQKKELELWMMREKRFLVKSGRTYTNPANWLLSAETADAQEGQQFQAILAEQNPRNHPKVILPHDSVIDRHTLFACPHECAMPRTVEGYIDVCGAFIKHAKQIILIDPNVGGGTRWGLMLKALFACIERNDTVVPQYVTTSTSLEQDKFRIGDMHEKLPAFIPAGRSLEVVLLEKDSRKDHNRYILTESGGIKFPWGLDTSSDASTDVVNLMGEQTHADMLREYTDIVSRIVIDRFVINGTRHN